jgi:hypothetical protein
MKENVDKLLEEITVLVIQRPGPKKNCKMPKQIHENSKECTAEGRLGEHIQ